MSSISPTGGDSTTLTCTSGSEARARKTFTTATPSTPVSIRFTIGRRPLRVRGGTTAGGVELFGDLTLYPGEHLLTFTPGASPYYIDWALQDVGKATVSNVTVQAAGVLTLASPWSTDDLPEVRQAQSLDVVWMAHRSHQTRVLERRSANSWSLRLFQPTDGPWEPTNQTDVALTPSAQVGEITLTASRAHFRSTDVGQLIRLTHQGSFVTASLTGASQASGNIRVTGVGAGDRSFSYEITGTFTGTVKLQRSIGNTLSWSDVSSFTGPTSGTLNDALDNQIIYYRWLMSAHSSGTAVATLTYSQGLTDGVVRIVAVGADNSATADVLEPLGQAAATVDWSWCSWGPRYGWPSVVALHDGRLYLGRDDRYWLSVSDSFESFAIGADASDAIGKRLSGGASGQRWALGASSLLVGASAQEFEIGSTAFDETLVPANAKDRPRTTRGSKPAQAGKVDDVVAFINRSGTRLYALMPDQGRYVAQDLTRLHREISGKSSSFVELAVQMEPEPRIWLVRSDGQVATLLLSLAEEVVGWQRYVPPPGDAIESVCVLPGSPEDAVYFVVRRVINGVTKRYVEKLAAELWNEDLINVNRLQCAHKRTGIATTSITGLAHLEGRTVAVWADGRRLVDRVVTGGAIALERASNTVFVGLNYVGRWKSGRLGFQSGVVRDRRVHRLGLLIDRTAGGALAWGRSETELDRLPDRLPDALMDGPVSLFTLDQSLPFEGEHSVDPRVVVVMDQPSPATVLGLVPHVETFPSR